MKGLLASLMSVAALICSLMFQPPAMAAMSNSPAIVPITIGTMSNKMDAKAKETEGKLESAFGELTGDKGHQIRGKAKQVQASAMYAAEDVKAGVKSTAKKVSDASGKLADKIN